MNNDHPRFADEDFGPDPARRTIIHFPAEPIRGILGSEPDTGPCDCPIHAGPAVDDCDCAEGYVCDRHCDCCGPDGPVVPLFPGSTEFGMIPRKTVTYTPPSFGELTPERRAEIEAQWKGEPSNEWNPGRDDGGPVPAPPARKMWLKTPEGTFVPLEGITLDGISYTGADDDEPVDVLDGAPIVPTPEDESAFYRSPEFLRMLGESILDAEDGDGPLTRAVESVTIPADDPIAGEPATYSREDGVRASPEFLERLRNLPATISLKPVRFKRPAVRSLLYALLMGDRWNIVAEVCPFDGPYFEVRRGHRRMIRVESIAQGMRYIADQEESDRDYRRLNG